MQIAPENRIETTSRFLSSPETQTQGFPSGLNDSALLRATFLKTSDKIFPYPPKSLCLAPFQGILKDPDLIKLSNSWFDVYKLSVYQTNDVYQIVKNKQKVLEWRTNITQSFYVHLKLKVIGAFFPKLDSLVKRFQDMIQNCEKALQNEIEFKSILADWTTYHRAQNAECATLLEADQKKLKLNEKNQKEKELKDHIIWVKMLSCLHQTRVEKHIPFMKGLLSDFLKKYEALLQNYKEESDEGFQTEMTEWIKLAQQLLQTHGQMNFIVNLPQSLIEKVDENVRSAEPVYLKGKNLVSKWIKLFNELQWIRKVADTCEQIIGAKMARIPFLEKLEEAKIQDQNNKQSYQARLEEYNQALNTELIRLQQNIRATQQEIQMASAQQLADRVRQLKAQLPTLNNMAGQIQSQIQSLPNQVIVAVNFGDPSNTYTRIYEKPSLQELKSKLNPLEIKTNMNANKILPEAIRIIKESEYDSLESLLRSPTLTMSPGGMAQNHIEVCKIKLEEAANKYRNTQNFIKQINEFNQYLLEMEEYVNDSAKLAAIFDNELSQKDQKNEMEFNQMFGFYYSTINYNYMTPFNFAILRNIISPMIKRVEFFDECIAGSKTKNSLIITTMSQKQFKAKVCKIIRARVNDQNRWDVTYNKRLSSMVMSDAIKFLASKKLWGAFINGCEQVKLQVYVGYDGIPNMNKPMSILSLNANYSLNGVMRDVIFALGNCVFAG